MRPLVVPVLLPVVVWLCACTGGAAPGEIRVVGGVGEAEVFDFVELSVEVDDPPAARNPFVDASLTAELVTGGGPPIAVEGFCDSTDGSIYRLRFMPTSAGRWDWKLEFRFAGATKRASGQFLAVEAGREGPLRRDPEFPAHFRRQGSPDRFFYYGATAYWLTGWKDEAEIERALDRMAAGGVNRLRVLLYGRHHDRPWNRPIVAGPGFDLAFEPWSARNPDSVERPGFDLTRFDPAHWRKFERMLAAARARGVVISVVFYMSHPPGTYHTASIPTAAFGEDEQRYFRYAVNRLAAFANVTWDVGNEHDQYRRVVEWPSWIASHIRDQDPYDHLLSAHNSARSYLGGGWYDYVLEQAWDGIVEDSLFDYMLQLRRDQAATGRVVPVINEEYGYEGISAERDTDSRRRLAWEITMAGCYQTTGETDRQGTGVAPDTGGGWANGRGDATMRLLDVQRPLLDLFTSFAWWRLEPRSDLVDDGLCLAAPGERYVVYLPGPDAPAETHVTSGRRTTIRLDGKRYRARWFDPRGGEYTVLPSVAADTWTTPDTPDSGDWVLLLEADES
ncbi:MAG: DUF4038 domain-containing protein [bacterium]|nr:DUF4038 domain-containing protein [bacterium]